MKEILTNQEKQNIIWLILSAISLVLSIINFLDSSIDWAWIAVILCGAPLLRDAIIGVITEGNIKAGVLVSIALVASILIGSIFVAGEVSFIMLLGTVLEDTTTRKTQLAIKKLLKVLPTKVKRISRAKEEMVSIEDVKQGDIIRVVPGEVICFDGNIVKGETSINQAYITGESMPVDKIVGDLVYSGTLNQFGTFEMEVTKTSQESSLQKLIDLVEKADLKQVKIVEKADKWATWIVLVALSISILTWIFTKELIRAVTILVVFCPCALVLATPTAIMAGIGNASKNGILIKNGIILEVFSKVTNFVFDKTGTLTYGKPVVTHVETIEKNQEEKDFLQKVASLESYSEHVIGKAIVSYADEVLGKARKKVQNFQLKIGKGIKGIVDGKEILAGNIEWLEQNQIEIETIQRQEFQSFIKKGATIIYVAIDKKLAGFLVLEDVVKTSIKDTIQELKQNGARTLLLTGDNQKTAQNIAEQLEIDEFKAHCSPEDKIARIEMLEAEKKLVCMIGDGVNDAPSLKKAQIGIAMGKVGSDIAIDSADVIFISDDVEKISYLTKLSKKVMKTIYINLCISMTVNFIFVILSITGILTPMQGAIVHNIGSFGVILNSSLILKWKEKKHDEKNNHSSYYVNDN